MGDGEGGGMKEHEQRCSSFTEVPFFLSLLINIAVVDNIGVIDCWWSLLCCALHLRLL